jgi:thiamine biosynthesis lipoprotein
MLGTLVAIHIGGIGAERDKLTAMAVAEQALVLMEYIGHVMSAHEPASDLGRLSRAMPLEVLELDPHTVHVLRATQYWTHRSRGAFNPARAGGALARRGARPGLNAMISEKSNLTGIEILSERLVRMSVPLSLDFGGIAKGYAVDQAAAFLKHHGVSVALINAGGDIRVVGCENWAVDVRHAGVHLRDRVFLTDTRMAESALATSTAIATDFVRTTVRGARQWRSASVLARDCMTADVLTKWALQSSLLCPSLKSALREHGARMWRT